ncbi:hypothetical protein C0Z17_14340 [Trinickia caryophylli]|nr:hypothetical protein C0Z17_14340 [Trinickia caryophylli]
MGGSLLEVLVSLTVLSLAAVASLGTQLVSGRASQLAMQREQAALAAVSLLERQRQTGPLESGLSGAQALATANLPDGSVSTTASGDGVGLVLVSWSAAGVATPGGASSRCGRSAADVRRACIALPFVD